MSEQKAEYRVVVEVEEVLVRVPKESKSMQWKEGGMPVAGVPAHWANGKVFQRLQRAGLPNGKPVVLNCNFYGIEKNNLGRQIVANIKVIKKTTARGESYTMLDIVKIPGVAISELKFYRGFELSKRLVLSSTITEITGTDSYVAIVPLGFIAVKHR